MGSNIKGIIQDIQTGLRTITGLRVERYDPLVVDPNSTPIAVVYTDHTTEERFGYGGALNQGAKASDHRIAVLLRHATADVDGQETHEDAWYDLVESVCAWLRSHQTLAAAGPTVQGKAQRSGETIEIEWERPTRQGGTIRYACVVHTPLRELFTG